ncbi:MAG: hypothetical protein AB1705_19110 [Verrucomicrobiota bacterium]
MAAAANALIAVACCLALAGCERPRAAAEIAPAPAPVPAETAAATDASDDDFSDWLLDSQAPFARPDFGLPRPPFGPLSREAVKYPRERFTTRFGTNEFAGPMLPPRMGGGPGRSFGPGRSPGGPPGSSELAQYDRNSDGKVSFDEFPADQTERFNQIDTDGDGVITHAEYGAMIAGTRSTGDNNPPARPPFVALQNRTEQ